MSERLASNAARISAALQASTTLQAQPADVLGCLTDTALLGLVAVLRAELARRQVPFPQPAAPRRTLLAPFPEVPHGLD